LGGMAVVECGGRNLVVDGESDRMSLTASQHSQSTAAAISSGVPIRPSGSDAITLSFGSVTGVPLHHFGVDDARANGIDPDIALHVIDRGVFRKIDHTVLRGGVRGSTSETPDSGARGGVHDRPSAALEHQRDLILHAHEHAPEVDRDDPVPLLLGNIGSRVGLLSAPALLNAMSRPPNISTV
jgi:hypothetical protein